MGTWCGGASSPPGREQIFLSLGQPELDVALVFPRGPVGVPRDVNMQVTTCPQSQFDPVSSCDLNSVLSWDLGHIL